MKKRLYDKWKDDLPEQQEDRMVQQAFRQKMDADLKRKWEQKLAASGIERPEQAKVVQIGSRKRWMSIAAAAVVVLIAGWFLFSQNQGEDAHQLASDYLMETAGQLAQVRMGEGEEGIAEQWSHAKEFYSQKQFREAISELNVLGQAVQLTPEQNLLLAFSHLQVSTPEYDQALEALSDAKKSDEEGSFQAEIEWTMALVLYQKGDLEKAGIALKRIVEEDGWYADKAKSLITVLEKEQ